MLISVDKNGRQRATYEGHSHIIYTEGNKRYIVKDGKKIYCTREANQYGAGKRKRDSKNLSLSSQSSNSSQLPHSPNGLFKKLPDDLFNKIVTEHMSPTSRRQLELTSKTMKSRVDPIIQNLMTMPVEHFANEAKRLHPSLKTELKRSLEAIISRNNDMMSHNPGFDEMEDYNDMDKVNRDAKAKIAILNGRKLSF